MPATIMQDTVKRFYDVDVSQTDSIVYINWVQANNIKGFLWMWRNVLMIFRLLKQSEGLLDTHIGIVSPRKFVIVSYWEHQEALRKAYQNRLHVKMMRFAYQNPDALILGNETYHVPYSTRYLNRAGGFALMGQVKTMSGQEFIESHPTPANESALASND